MKERSESWFSKQNQYVMCPVYGCHHIGNITTKAHCKVAHQKSRDDIQKDYGMPFIIKMKEGKNHSE